MQEQINHWTVLEADTRYALCVHAQQAGPGSSVYARVVAAVTRCIRSVDSWRQEDAATELGGLVKVLNEARLTQLFERHSGFMPQCTRWQELELEERLQVAAQLAQHSSKPFIDALYVPWRSLLSLQRLLVASNPERELIVKLLRSADKADLGRQLLSELMPRREQLGVEEWASLCWHLGVDEAVIGDFTRLEACDTWKRRGDSLKVWQQRAASIERLRRAFFPRGYVSDRASVILQRATRQCSLKFLNAAYYRLHSLDSLRAGLSALGLWEAHKEVFDPAQLQPTKLQSWLGLRPKQPSWEKRRAPLASVIRDVSATEFALPPDSPALNPLHLRVSARPVEAAPRASLTVLVSLLDTITEQPTSCPASYTVPAMKQGEAPRVYTQQEHLSLLRAKLEQLQAGEGLSAKLQQVQADLQRLAYRFEKLLAEGKHEQVLEECVRWVVIEFGTGAHQCGDLAESATQTIRYAVLGEKFRDQSVDALLRWIAARRSELFSIVAGRLIGERILSGELQGDDVQSRVSKWRYRMRAEYGLDERQPPEHVLSDHITATSLRSALEQAYNADLLVRWCLDEHRKGCEKSHPALWPVPVYERIKLLPEFPAKQSQLLDKEGKMTRVAMQLYLKAIGVLF